MKVQLSTLMLIIGLSLPTWVAGQVQKQKFGKADPKLVKMTSYEADTTAEAVVLFDHGEVTYRYVGEQLQQVMTVHRRIKILKEGGLNYADVAIPFYAYRGLESISNLKAITYYLDDAGKVVEQKVDKRDFLEEDRDGRVRLKKFSFPNAQPGAVLEYVYQRISDNFYSIPTWYFQERIPVAHSQFIANIHKDMSYRNLTLGAAYPIQQEKGTGSVNLGGGGSITVNINSYVCKNIPALIEEPYVTSMSNYFYRLEMQLEGIYIPGYVSEDYLKSWNQLAKGMLEDEDFGEHIQTNKYIKETVAQLVQEAGEDPEAQIAAIYEWVQKNTEWNDRYGKYANVTQRTILNDREGNGTSINLLLISLLREADFDANPMLISTRGNGLAQSIFPSLRQFNHTIVAVETETKPLLLDAHSKRTPYDMLPPEDLNTMGMVVKEGGAEWINIEPVHKNQQDVQILAALSSDGTLKGNLTDKESGYACLSERKKLQNAKDQEDYLTKYLTQGFTEVAVLSQELNEGEYPGDPLVSKCELETTDFVQAAGEFIYLEPMLNQGETENPFKLETRSYPVNFGSPISSRYILTLILPEGYAVEEMPKPTRVSLPEGAASFTYQVAQAGAQLQIMSEIKINKTEFSPDEYGQIRQLFDMIVAKHAEQIVLKKGDPASATNNEE